MEARSRDIRSGRFVSSLTSDASALSPMRLSCHRTDIMAPCYRYVDTVAINRAACLPEAPHVAMTATWQCKLPENGPSHHPGPCDPASDNWSRRSAHSSVTPVDASLGHRHRVTYGLSAFRKINVSGRSCFSLQCSKYVIRALLTPAGEPALAMGTAGSIVGEMGRACCGVPVLVPWLNTG